MKLKHTTQQPLNLKWIRPIQRLGNSIRPKWAKKPGRVSLVDDSTLGVLLIRRTYFLTDMLTNTRFSNFPLCLFRLTWFGSKINILRIKIRFKATHHLQNRENLHFIPPTISPSLSFHLLAGCRFDQTISECL